MNTSLYMMYSYFWLQQSNSSSETRGIMILNDRRLCDDERPQGTGVRAGPCCVNVKFFSVFLLPPLLLLSTTGGWSFLQYKLIRVYWMLLWSAEKWGCITKVPTNPRWFTMDRIFGSESIINPYSGMEQQQHHTTLRFDRFNKFKESHGRKRDERDRQSAEERDTINTPQSCGLVN